MKRPRTKSPDVPDVIHTHGVYSGEYYATIEQLVPETTNQYGDLIPGRVVGRMTRSDGEWWEFNVRRRAGRFYVRDTSLGNRAPSVVFSLRTGEETGRAAQGRVGNKGGRRREWGSRLPVGHRDEGKPEFKPRFVRVGDAFKWVTTQQQLDSLSRKTPSSTEGRKLKE